MAAVTSSRPQPDSESWPSAQPAQPVAGVWSAAAIRRIALTCSGRSVGRRLSSTAAAALTCGAAKDVPCAARYSSGPQLEYPCSEHDGYLAVRGRGRIERISWPGAARSL